jgi:anti-sigma B factor antagonist
MSEGTVRFDTHGNVLVAHLAGEIDLSNAERLGIQIAEASPDSTQPVVLDLTEVEHIDSYGIVVIYGLRQRLREHETPLVLVIPKDARIRRALELVGVHDLMPVKEELEAALHALG